MESPPFLTTSTQHNCSCEFNVGFLFDTSTCLTSVFSQKSFDHSHLNNSSRATVMFYYNCLFNSLTIPCKNKKPRNKHDWVNQLKRSFIVFGASQPEFTCSLTYPPNPINSIAPKQKIILLTYHNILIPQLWYQKSFLWWSDFSKQFQSMLKPHYTNLHALDFVGSSGCYSWTKNAMLWKQTQAKI